ncbi:MAG: HNH endonuclease [Chloroflexi bacterium 44-23]|nr:MAG: HNH endonuclease [Chloroflexi bacterium 44-23]
MNNSVLVLNANFEPINVCNVKRAFCLIWMEKATLVANGRGMINTIDQQYPIPSIIRLMKMVKRPKQEVSLSRKEIFRRDQHTCQYCGKTSTNLTIDHVIPRHLGGKTSWENLVTSCSACNHRKGGRTLKEANMQLLKAPKPPSRSALYIYGHHLNANEEWMHFLEGW